MGTEFKAASGRTINIADDGSLLFGRANGYLSRETAYDAEEYFRAKHDEELGRWRYPLDPQWIAIEGGRNLYGRRTVALFNEQTFESQLLNDKVLETSEDDAPRRAARAFFDAHPERKPWEDAKPGELWALTHAGHGSQVWRRGEDNWRIVSSGQDITFSPASALVAMDGHRVWPEDAA